MRLKNAALFGPIALLLACPKAPPPTPVPPEVTEARELTPQVHALEDQARALLREQDERVWKSWTQGTPADLAATYKGKESLFTPEAIAKIHRLRELTIDPLDARALGRLETYFVGEYLARRTEDLTGTIANLTASLKFTHQGQDYAYRDLERLLANEKSALKRRALYEAATPAVERLTEAVKRRNEGLVAALKAIGTNYAAYGADLRQADLTRLRQLADELLEVTQKPYLQVMDRLAHDELGQKLEDLRRADLPRLFRPEVVDRYFPKDALWTRANATAQGLGIDVKGIKGLTLDLEDRPQKDPRGLTLPIEIPTDVRVSLKPADGVREQLSFLHELGHALHDTHSREMRFELSKLGDATVPEAFASTFEDLAEDPVWLTQQAGLSGDVLARFLSTASARRLFLVRRAAGRLLYSIALHTGDEQDPAKLYTRVMSRTLGIPVAQEDAARALLDDDEFFQSADPLRAWMLSAQLEAQLKTRFGPTWWESRDAGAFLIALWRVGNAPTPEELARTFGEHELEPEVLLLKLGTALGVPISIPAHPSAPEPAPDAGTPLSDAGVAPDAG
jgi:hypothetical protein